MAMNYILQAINDGSEMLKARAALKIITGKEYQNVVGSWKPAIRHYMEMDGSSVVQVATAMTANHNDISKTIQIWAAAYEIVEEECAK